jgi:hypothetical protein
MPIGYQLGLNGTEVIPREGVERRLKIYSQNDVLNPGKHMSVQIDVRTPLERFRRFMIYNTCLSFIPKGYLRDPTIFPERSAEKGQIYLEAAAKIELAQIRDITFVKAIDVLGVIYNSKSGNTRLRWRQISGTLGRLTGIASLNSIVNLLESKVITREYVESLISSSTALAQAQGREAREE